MRSLAAMIALLAACGDNLAGPVAVEDYPATVREAVCRQLIRCGEIESFDTCMTTQLPFLHVAFTASELAAIRTGRILYSGAAARACVDGIAGASCDVTSLSGRGLPDACQAITAGAGRIGDACGFDEECVSQRCALPDCGMACCTGSCTGEPPPARAAMGEPCTSAGCVAGAFCDPGSHRCAAVGGSGTACEVRAACQYGLDCIDGRCAVPPALGQPCTSACRDLGTTCSSANHTCVAVGLVGAPCSIGASPPDCAPEYLCDRTGHCSAGIALGQPCGVGDQCADDRAACDTPPGQLTGVCGLPKPDGSSCARDAVCDNLYCDPLTSHCAPEPVCL
jgi:hypothetical protein